MCPGLGVSDGEEMVVTLTERQASRGETRIARQGRVSLGELLGPPSLSFFLIDVSVLDLWCRQLSKSYSSMYGLLS